MERRDTSALRGSSGVDLEAVLQELARREAGPDFSGMGLGELVDHVTQTHHGYLRAELPRLSSLVDKVAGAHGGEHPELYELRSVFKRLRAELEEHTSREERVLFPALPGAGGGRDPARAPVRLRGEPHRRDDGRACGIRGGAAQDT